VARNPLHTRSPLHRRRTALLAVVLLVLSVLPLADRSPSSAESPGTPAHHVAGGYRNLDAAYRYGMARRTRHLLRRALERWPDRGPAPAVVANDGAALRANGREATLTWVGHATFLVQLDGLNVLTDPIWSDRASPLGFAGPRRLVPPGLAFEDLPRVHAVVISHDHYDHLDVATVRRLAGAHAPRFFVPLGLKAWLAGLGVTDVVELDWWERATLGGVEFVATPAQHSSGRGLHDQNRRLWAGWAVVGASKRLYFAGDTGYFAGAREIGARLGPFDVAAIPIGGYSGAGGRHPNHVDPEEAVKLLEDVRGRRLAPMHFATFELNREPFAEPPARLLREARRRGLETRIQLMTQGESIHW
jgi:N-acyl-phosphatidylethanolamine-hydrolysing phospholipase D